MKYSGLKYSGLMIGATLLTLGLAAPAGAQVYIGAGPDGVAVGVHDRDHDWRHRHHHWRGDYASDCRVTRERIHVNGRTITKTRRVCD